MHRTQISSRKQKFQAYSSAEFPYITAAAKSHVRECVHRIHGRRALLARWRAGEIDRDLDKHGWERGWLLDHIDRHDEVPRYSNGSRHMISTAHGGTATLFAELYPTPQDVAAAAALFADVGDTTDHGRRAPHGGAKTTTIVDVADDRGNAY